MSSFSIITCLLLIFGITILNYMSVYLLQNTPPEEADRSIASTILLCFAVVLLFSFMLFEELEKSELLKQVSNSLIDFIGKKILLY